MRGAGWSGSTYSACSIPTWPSRTCDNYSTPQPPGMQRSGLLDHGLADGDTVGAYITPAIMAEGTDVL